jgi:hypothetical protein
MRIGLALLNTFLRLIYGLFFFFFFSFLLLEIESKPTLYGGVNPSNKHLIYIYIYIHFSLLNPNLLITLLKDTAYPSSPIAEQYFGLAHT